MFRILDLFAGIGGFSYAAHQLGIGITTQFVEINPYCQKVLSKNFPNIPVHNDITTYNPVRGEFDFVTFGSPCQDLSQAGKQKGIHGDRSGLFFHATRIVKQVQPAGFIMENVTGIRKWQTQVLDELQAIGGYNLYWFSVSVKQLGGCHQRERWFCIGWKNNVSDTEQSSRFLQEEKNGIFSREQPASVCEDRRRRQEQTTKPRGCDILSRTDVADSRHSESGNSTQQYQERGGQILSGESDNQDKIRCETTGCDRMGRSTSNTPNSNGESAKVEEHRNCGQEGLADATHTESLRPQEVGEYSPMWTSGESPRVHPANTHSSGKSGDASIESQGGATIKISPSSKSTEEKTFPRICGSDDGIPTRLDRLINQLMTPYEAHEHIKNGTASDSRELKDRAKRIQALGNAVTPQQAAICWYLLTLLLNNHSVAK